jgi:hypothetical protein
MTKWIDHLLSDTLGARAAATPPTPCLDAETAAAFVDETLSAHERSGAEAHAADCARCQAVLAALARTTPPAVARAWWRRPAIAWLAPLTVAATAVIIWVTVPRRTNNEPAVQSVREGARSVASDSRRTPETAAAAPLGSQSARGSAAVPFGAPVPDAKQERDRTTPRKTLPEATRPSALADSRVMAQPAAPGAPAAAEARSADAPRASAPLPQAAPQPSGASAASGANLTAPAEPASRPTPAETVIVTTEATGRALARRFDAALDMVIASSNPISRWRIGTGGVVQHSADGGLTWQTQSTGVSVTLTAGSSPSPLVCWLVGPAGLVLLSTDEGRSWQRLAFPAAIDLTSVRATDDNAATVVTSDGRTFSTSDRGRNWGR